MVSGFSPITKTIPSSTPFNDLRLVRRHKRLRAAMARKKSSIINQLAQSYKERRAYYRFMSNDKVTVSELMGMGDKAACQAVSGKHVLAIGDTSEISLKKQIAHIKDAGRVGLLSDNKTPGFIAHGQMLLDASSGHGLCLSSLLLWNRPAKAEKGKGPKPAYEQRESYKWELGIKDSQNIISQAQMATYVFDQEADIFDLYAGVKSLKEDHHLIVRSHYNRKVETQGKQMPLWDFMGQAPFSHTYRLKVRPLKRRNESRRKQQKRTGREALIQLRYRQVTLLAPKTAQSKSKLNLWVVEALESPETVPQSEEPIHWRLVTTHPVQSSEEAMQVIRWYEMRWMIEQLFRLIKRKGFNVERCELQYLDAILKMTVLSFKAAFNVLRLMLARDKPHSQPISHMFTQGQRICLAVLNEKYQGNTTKQRNPYPPGQLSWAAWVIARMGGWKGLKSQGLPGPITMKRGLDQFYTYFDAWKLFSAQA